MKTYKIQLLAMRLFMIITAGLFLSLGLNLPVMSQSSIETAQIFNSNNLNSRLLQFNRRLWNQQNISSYRYTFSNSCFCIPEATRKGYTNLKKECDRL